VLPVLREGDEAVAALEGGRPEVIMGRRRLPKGEARGRRAGARQLGFRPPLPQSAMSEQGALVCSLFPYLLLGARVSRDLLATGRRSVRFLLQTN
jgi:hypothetical protein